MIRPTTIAMLTENRPGVMARVAHLFSRRGFNLQNVELVLSGAVDPYFTAQTNIIFVEAPDGETVVEVEELYATTSSLPANLQVRVGHFFTEFGRLNPQHPHYWDFVDHTLGQVRMFGTDGLRASGLRLSWPGKRQRRRWFPGSIQPSLSTVSSRARATSWPRPRRPRSARTPASPTTRCLSTVALASARPT